MPANPFGNWTISPCGITCGHWTYLLALGQLGWLLGRRSHQYRWYTGEHLLN